MKALLWFKIFFVKDFLNLSLSSRVFITQNETEENANQAGLKFLD